MEKPSRLSPEEWIEAGLKALAEAGPSGLKAEILARKLKVSRGSFYWHFRNVEDFQVAVLARWEKSAVDEPYEYAKRGARAAPEVTLIRLIERSFSVSVKLESAVLSWARESQATANAVARVNKRRIHLLAKLFADLGHDEGTARSRAALLCSIYLGRMHLAANELDLNAQGELIRTLIVPAK